MTSPEMGPLVKLSVNWAETVSGRPCSITEGPVYRADSIRWEELPARLHYEVIPA